MKFFQSASRNQASSTKQKTNRIRKIESLETRNLMAAGISGLSGGGSVYVWGTEGYDNVTIESVEATVRPTRLSKSTLSTGLPNFGQSLDQVLITVRNYYGEIQTQESFPVAHVDKIVVDAFGGNDNVRNDTDIPSDLRGGSGRDVLIGGGGDDVIDGGSGDDRIYGRDGDDLLKGQVGNDWIYGNNGDDQVFGGFGRDYLYGDKGHDSLFGDHGTDTLVGGADSDRFLSWETKGLFTPYTDEDHHVDLNESDAKIIFRNGEFTTNNFGVYLTGTWDAEKIERIDAALKIIHDETGNTDLLKRADGKPMKFHFHDAPEVGASGIRGFNDGDIHLTSYQFSGSDNYLIGYTLHEIGHNWAKPATSHWPLFLLLRKTSDNFVSNYAESGGAGEDWSETFAAYFMQQAEMPYYFGEGASAAPDKVALMADWVESMST